MKKILSLMAVFIFMLSTTTFAEENIRTISVNGEGIIETSPDRATISVGVVSRAKDPSKVQAENAKIATEIINSVVALGIERKNIRTGNYNFQQTYRNDENRRRISDGYEVTNSVTITVDNLKLVGKVIDTALSHGANSVDSLNFGLKNKESFQAEAIKLAVRDARAKAEIVARELGKNIIGVRHVEVHSASVSSPRHNKMMMAAANAEDFSTPIEGGSLSCSASVDIDFEIN